MPFFLLDEILLDLWALVNPGSMPILKSLASAIAEISKENPKFLGAPLTQATHKVFAMCDFMMGLCKSKMCKKFEIARLSLRRDIKGEPPNSGELPYPMATPTFSCGYVL